MIATTLNTGPPDLASGPSTPVRARSAAARKRRRMSREYPLSSSAARINAQKVRLRRMVSCPPDWPDVQPGSLNPRWAQLLAIANDPSSSEDNCQCALHDLFMEFDREL